MPVLLSGDRVVIRFTRPIDPFLLTNLHTHCERECCADEKLMGSQSKPSKPSKPFVRERATEKPFGLHRFPLDYLKTV